MKLKQFFPRALEVAYLDSAAEGLPAPGSAEAAARYFRDKHLGSPGRRYFYEVEAETLALAATLMGAGSNDVTLLSNASEALYLIAGSLQWRPGDEVIISELEFPSNVLPWLRLREQGVKVIYVPDDKGVLHWGTVAEHITARTRLVSLSLVSYKTGAYLRGVPELSAAIRKVGGFLSIDGTQALGRCPVSLDGVDYFMSSSFKWLMGPHGLGLVYLSPEFRKYIQPPSLGWHSVKNAFSFDRFERYSLKEGAGCLAAGMPNFLSIYALRESLRFLLQANVSTIYKELQPVVEKLRHGFERLGCDMLTPAGSEWASGIVAFRHDRSDEIGAALERERVIVWGGDNRVRASVHLYDDMDDIDHCLAALSSVFSELSGSAAAR
jgi:cysteine desulfurase / selenocysteine lyase